MPMVCMRRRRDRDAWLLGETIVEGEIPDQSLFGPAYRFRRPLKTMRNQQAGGA